MNSAISSALSGLMANTARLNATASNVANARTRGVVPETPGADAPGEAPRVYQAVTTQFSTDASGGVRATTAPASPAYHIEYDPSASFANAEGHVAAPNVNLAREAVDQMTAHHAYKANISTIRTADDMQRSLLDLQT